VQHEGPGKHEARANGAADPELEAMLALQGAPPVKG